MATETLTSHLLALDPAAFTAATQSPFLAAAGAGRLPKSTLGKWLANDRLYIHAYIKAAGRTLAIVDLPQTTPTSIAPATQLVDWLLTTLTELRREERLFIDVAARYGLSIDLETDVSEEGGRDVERVPGAVKSAGLVMFERLFGSLHPAASVGRSVPLPWLEAAVVFWGTERVYLEAWTWARGKQGGGDGDGKEDADGGALRKEFIPNWSNDGFREFVQQLGVILDGAVNEAVGVLGEGIRPELLKRAEKVWRELVAAETAFWPDVE
ncbi:hypothetical protein N0V93_009894 [Gnomoniopsis smithogilvyi]|uniref:Thiaminase-2/PQQC domain-containing protein n=1 Tax=Gnomoniopsis smithogilvyi TaxID=1191159 RepID=A0A9W9CSR4_9PEZI|nr:hypothetical protein N0V93_009894 [Gnomoniopsis smithogilvyi]